MGLQFSINGVISPGTRKPPQYEKDGLMQFTKLSDITGKVVLIGDCAVGGNSPEWAMPARAFFGAGLDKTNNWKAYWDSLSLSDRTLRLNNFGPWTMITDRRASSGQGGATVPVNYYGHSGEKTNLAFTDAHVEAIGDKKVKLRLFEW